MLPDAAVYRQKVFQILSFFFSAAYYMGCLGRPHTHSGQFRQSHMAISHMLLLVTEVKPCWQGLLYSDGLPSAKSVFLAFFFGGLFSILFLYFKAPMCQTVQLADHAATVSLSKRVYLSEKTF